MSEDHYNQMLNESSDQIYKDYDVIVKSAESDNVAWSDQINKNNLQYIIEVIKTGEKFFIDIDEKILLDETGMDLNVVKFLTKYPALTDFLSDKADMLIRTKFNKVGENKKRMEMGWPTLIDYYTMEMEDFHKYKLYGKS